MSYQQLLFDPRLKFLLIPILLVVSGYVFLHTFVTIRRRYFSKIDLTLPGPPSAHVIWGNIQQILAEAPGIPHAKWGKKYGGVVRYYRLLGGQGVVLMDPASLHYVLSTKSYEYPKPNETRGALKDMLGEGILFAEGDVHKRQRKIMTPAFSVGFLKQLVPIFFDKSMKLRDKWLELLELGQPDDSAPVPASTEEEEKDGIVVDVLKWLNKVTLDIIGITGFGYEFDSLENDDSPFYAAFRLMFPMTRPTQLTTFQIFIFTLQIYAPWILKIFPTKIGKQMKAAFKSVRDQGLELVRERKEEVLGDKAGRDLISLLIRANVAADRKGDKSLSDEELLGQVQTFLLAGHETTSSAASFLLHYLSINPEVQSKLRAEILASRSTMPPATDVDIIEHLNSLPYLDACCKEVLRIAPPVGATVRCAEHDDVIPTSDGKSFVIKKGQQIFIGIYGFNTLERYWGQDAAEFRPERWLDGDIEKRELAAKVPVGVFAGLSTFIEGPRSCIGYRFAVWELKAIIWNLVGDFEFNPRNKDTKIETRSILISRPRIIGEASFGSRLPLRIRKFVG